MKEIEAVANKEKLAGKIAIAEEEKQAHDVNAAKQGEWNDFFGGQDDDEKHYAGGDNQFLEDDFM